MSSTGAHNHIVAHPGRQLAGRITVPGDKSIGHRSLIFASLAEGRSHITGMSGGLDNLATAQIFRDMGVSMELSDDGREATVEGVGLHGLSMPKGDLDCGNSGTSMRLVAGILAAQRTWVNASAQAAGADSSPPRSAHSGNY